MTRRRDLSTPALAFGILGALGALSMSVFVHGSGTLFAAVNRGNYSVRWQFLAVLISVMCIVGAATSRSLPLAGSGILLGCIVLISMSVGLNPASAITLLLIAASSGLAIAAAVLQAPRRRLLSLVGRILGWLFIATGAFVLLQDLWASIVIKRWAPIALGQLWYNADRSSLNLVQAVTQRYLSVVLWDAVLRPILLSWAFAVLIVVGLALLILCRRPGRPNPRDRNLTPRPS